MTLISQYKTEYIEYFNYMLSDIHLFKYINMSFDFFRHSGIFVKTSKNNYYIIDYASTNGTLIDTQGDIRFTLANNFKYLSPPKYDKLRKQEYRMIEIMGPLYRESSDKIRIINNKFRINCTKSIVCSFPFIARQNK